MRDEIFIARRHPRAALAATLLRPVGGERHALDVALQADGNDALFALDEIFIFDLALDVDDLGFARRRKFGADRRQFVLDDVHDPGARRQNREEFFDLAGDFVQLFGDLFTAQRRQAGEPQIKNGFGLLFRQTVTARPGKLVARIGDQFDQRRHIFGWPIARHQLFFGLSGRRRKPDQLDHLVDVGNRNCQTNENVGALAGLHQLMLDAPRHDLLPERRERANHIAQRQAFGAPADDRQHVGAERRLQV